MRVPLSWMREFNDCELPPEEIAKRMTLGGLEVESTERIGVYSREVISVLVAVGRKSGCVCSLWVFLCIAG